MSDFTAFMEAADERLVQAIGVFRDARQLTQRDGSIALVAGTDESFETGLTIVAIGTVGHDVDSVEVTLHGFRDGQRVALEPVSLGGELIVALRNA